MDVVDDALFDAAGPGLRVVANFGVGYDSVDVDAATRRGIVVANTPDVLTAATAELTLALMLALLRRVAEGDRLVRRREEWALAPTFMLGEGLAGKTLGIVGLGRIGREVARLAEAFGMRVVHTRGSGSYEGLPLERLLGEADVVSLHVPLTAETRHLVGRDELRLMKPGAVLVNVARGPIVDETALVEALAAGEIAGAALDVYEHEPEVHQGLLVLENVVLTPHLGSSDVRRPRGDGNALRGGARSSAAREPPPEERGQPGGLERPMTNRRAERLNRYPQTRGSRWPSSSSKT